MITEIEIVAYVTVSLYSLVLLFTTAAYFAIPRSLSSTKYNPTVAIVVAVRNEESTIRDLLKSIEGQDWAGSFEVLIVDDHSTDSTKDYVEDFISSSRLSIRVISSAGIGKKAALTIGIAATNADLILVTDGDCMVGSTWISSHVAGFANPQIQFSAGLVAALPNKHMLRDILQTEMIFLQVVSGGLFKIGKASMCNGASMAFRRSFFVDNDGFQNDKFVSGDDIFLLQKARKMGAKTVNWNCARDGIVRTRVATSFSEAIQQRRRWLSKIGGYSGWTLLLIGPLFLAVQLLLPAAIISTFVYPTVLNTFTIVFLVKSLVELLLLSLASPFFGEQRVINKFPISVFVYNIISLGSVFGLFSRNIEWKNRSWKFGKVK